MPFAFELIPEIPEIPLSLRHIIYGNYRIIYLVGDDRVSIIHAARVLTPDQLGLGPPAAPE
jgi:hypothetical protein